MQILTEAEIADKMGVLKENKVEAEAKLLKGGED